MTSSGNYDRLALASSNESFTYPNESFFDALDASLKRNSSLVKKLKAITEDSKASLLLEIKACKLIKYLTEVTSAIMENRFKQLQDIQAAAEICCVLHQRYSEFSGLLLQGIQKVYASSGVEEDEKALSARVSKHRAYLRFLVELVLIKIFKEEKMIVHLLRKLLQNDKEFVYLTTAVTLIKTYPVECFGIKAKDFSGTEESFCQGLTLLREETRSSIIQIYTQYFEGLTRSLVSVFKDVKGLDKHYTDYSHTKGDLTDKQKSRYETALKQYEKYQVNAQSLSEYLNLPMPELKEEEITRLPMISADPCESLLDGKAENINDSSDSLFDDEESQQFYESLTDVRLVVPATLLNSAPAIKSPTADETAAASSAERNETEVSETEEAMDMEIAKMEKSTAEDDLISSEILEAEKDDSAPVSNSAALDTFLQKLPTLMNRDLIDQAAIEFCYLNSKGARRKLVKTLWALPRSRIDLIPYYSRLIATLKGHIADVGEEIPSLLLSEFRGLRFKKDIGMAEIKARNIRYIAELIKFRVMKTHVAFFCLQALADNFAGTNVDTACHLLESCGRYLFKKAETNKRLNDLLEIIMKKKNLQSIDNRQRLMIENAFFMVNPPAKVESKKRPKSSMELYLIKLIHIDLNAKTVDHVLKQIRKLDWSLPEILKSLESIFLKVWKIRYSNIHLVASMVSGLCRYQEEFTVWLVDALIEEIRIGLETNNFKHNQRRIAIVKYLSELYNYQLIDESLIFDTLYTILTFGHENGLPLKGKICIIDSPNDFFRVRLCCVILDTCGQYFDYGTLKRKLNMFLVFLQYYIFTKNPLSMDVEFLVLDLFESLRPKMKLLKSLDEAILELERIKAEQMRKKNLKIIKNIPGGSNEKIDIDSSDSEPEEVKEERIKIDEREKSEAQEKILDEDFNRAFSEMMTESVDARKSDKKPEKFDAAIPYIKSSSSSSKGKETTGNPASNVSFTLLARKGGKVTTKELAIPSQTTLAKNVLLKKEEERQEQLKMKRLVLGYEKTIRDD